MVSKIQPTSGAYIPEREIEELSLSRKDTLETAEEGTEK